MATEQERQRRVDAAKQLASLVQHIGDIRSVDHRYAMVHDQLAGAIAQICHPEGEKGTFNAAQIECLTQIALHIALVVDPNGKRPSGIRRFREGWAKQSWGEKAKLVLAVPGALAVFGGFAFWIWTTFLHPSPPPSAPPAQTQRDAAT